MQFGKIVIKNEYEEEKDLVFRPLVRAFKKIGATCFLDGDSAYLIGTIDNDGIFKEFLTGKEIDYLGYEELSFDDINQFLESVKESGLTKEVIDNIKKVVNKIVFKESLNVDDYTGENMREDANDRVIELKGYEKGLSLISPYDRENPNRYKDFNYKCRVLNSRIMMNRKSK